MGANYVQRHGRLTRDPERKEYKNKNGELGTRASFSLAVNNSYGAKTETSFYDCTIFGKKADAVLKFLKKGSEVVIYGEMEQYEYEKDGQNRRGWNVKVNEFDFCGSKGAQNEEPTPEGGFGPITDSDVPF